MRKRAAADIPGVLCNPGSSARIPVSTVREKDLGRRSTHTQGQAGKFRCEICQDYHAEEAEDQGEIDDKCKEPRKKPGRPGRSCLIKCHGYFSQKEIIFTNRIKTMELPLSRNSFRLKSSLLLDDRRQLPDARCLLPIPRAWHTITGPEIPPADSR